METHCRRHRRSLGRRRLQSGESARVQLFQQSPSTRRLVAVVFRYGNASRRCRRFIFPIVRWCSTSFSNMASSSENSTGTKPTNTSKITNEKLMETIQNYEAIYNKACKDYKDQQRKKNAWVAVADELKIQVSEAQSRYNSIRTMFSKYLKGIKAVRSGSGRQDVVIKEEFEYLRWLIVHIKHRETTSNAKFQTEETNQTTVTDDQVEGDIDSETEGSAGQPALSDGEDGNISKDKGQLIDDGPTSTLKGDAKGKEYKNRKQIAKPCGQKRPWAEDNKLDPVDKAIINTMKMFKEKYQTPDKRMRNEENEEVAKDDETLFCLSLASKLKRLPPHLLTRAQLQILQVVNDVETASRSAAHGNNSSSRNIFQGSNWSDCSTPIYNAANIGQFFHQQGSPSDLCQDMHVNREPTHQQVRKPVNLCDTFNSMQLPQQMEK